MFCLLNYENNITIKLRVMLRGAHLIEKSLKGKIEKVNGFNLQKITFL